MSPDPPTRGRRGVPIPAAVPPWALSRAEWEARLAACTPHTAPSPDTRASGSQAVARIRELMYLVGSAYGIGAWVTARDGVEHSVSWADVQAWARAHGHAGAGTP